MKPPKFHRGQAVTPNKRSNWIKNEGWEDAPKFGEIYHVQDTRYNPEFEAWYVRLEEFYQRIGIREDRLDPVEIKTEDIDELIKETILQPA